MPTPPPELAPTAHKGEAGRLLCLCGNPTMPGAAALVTRAAQRAGAGLVTLAVFSREVVAAVAPSSPETVFLDLSRTKDLFASRLPREIVGHPHAARVVGPGLGKSGQTRELVRCLVTSVFEGPLVLDADALNVLAGALEAASECRGPLILTPHPGEAARLAEEPVPADDDGRLACARGIAERSRSICVLKGRHTVVTDGERDYVNTTGNPGMATAGSGDVLAGILGAYLTLARPDSDWTPFDAVCAAVHVHGLAGDIAAERNGVRGAIASDQIAALPEAQVRHRAEAE
ncbi:MAG: NAD(P)H-hydrate dehydratase [bacterium]|nr:NAD(P)H-hydrate dehydratase [bacterium]